MQVGNGPLASVAPGDVHWGLVVLSALRCTLFVVSMALHSIHLVQLGNGPLESVAPGDVHWGLVVPGALQCTLVVQLGDGPNVSVVSGDLHWGLVVPKVIQFTNNVQLGALGDVHWDLAVSVICRRPFNVQLVKGPLDSGAARYGFWLAEPFLALYRQILLYCCSTWIERFPSLDGLLQRFHYELLWALVHAGTMLAAAFRTGCLLATLALFRLLSHSLSLKGGSMNFDNIIRFTRCITSGVPVSMYAGLASAPARTLGGRRRKPLCHSRDFWILLCLNSAFLPGALASGSYSSPAAPADVPETRNFDGLPGDAIINHATAARDFPEPESSDEESSISSVENVRRNILFRLLFPGFGSEYIGLSFARQTSLNVTLGDLPLDSEVVQHVSEGRFARLCHPAISESFGAIWVPMYITKGPRTRGPLPSCTR